MQKIYTLAKTDTIKGNCATPVRKSVQILATKLRCNLYAQFFALRKNSSTIQECTFRIELNSIPH